MASGFQNKIPKFITSLNKNRREGTKNQGMEYELEICALIALRAAIYEEVTNFWIAQNVVDPIVGLFDDVVLVLEKYCQVTVYCIQLKHFSGRKRKSKLTFAAFQQESTRNNKNVLLLDDYFESIENVLPQQRTKNGSSTEDINYILFTNRPKEQSERRFVNVKENTDIKIINTGGQVFKLLEYESLNAQKLFSPNVLHNFFIFSNQIHEEDLEKTISTTLFQFAKFNSEKLKDVLSKYMKFMTDWLKGKCGGDRFLTRDEVRFKLGEIMLTPHVYNFPEVSSVVPDRVLKGWIDVVNKFNVIILENGSRLTVDTFDRCLAVISNAMLWTLINLRTVDGVKKNACKLSKWNEEEFEFLWGIEDLEDVTAQILYQYLWKNDILPFVVRVECEQDIESFLKVCSIVSGKIIFLYNGCLSRETRNCISDLQQSIASQKRECLLQNVKVLHNFSNLHLEMKQFILNRPMTFQGRIAKVGDVFTDEQLTRNLLTVDIMEILTEKFNVGKKFIELPNIFISRCLNSIFVNPKVFSQCEVYIVNCSSKDVFLQYAQDSNLKFDYSKLRILSKNIEPSFFEVMTTISCSKNENESVIILNIDYDMEHLQKSINAQNAKYSRIRIFSLDVNINGCFKLVPIDFTATINVILNETTLFYRFLESKKLAVNSCKIYEFATVNFKCWPINCQFVIATDKEATFLRKYCIENISFHFYKIRNNEDDLYLEFVGSMGFSNMVNKFIENFRHSDHKFEFHNCFMYSNVNIISGSPGMGKSVLINYLIKICPADYWVILINFNTDLKYFSESLSEVDKTVDHLKYFLQYDNLDVFERQVFDKRFEEKMICIFCDGYDEIEPKLEQQVCKFLKHLIQSGFILFVTTRTVKVESLRANLNSTARTLVPFSRQDQLEYLTKYYASKTKANADDINEFVNNLLSKSNSNMSAWDMEFSGIPLQTLMISEIYLEECQKFCSTKENTLHQSVDVLDLYKRFIDYKISNLKIKDNVNDPKLEYYFYDNIERSLDSHKLCAVKAIFQRVSSEGNVKRFVSKIKERKDKIGLIERFLEDDTPVFVHRTFAEYLAALYMSENLDDDFVKTLLDTVLKNSVYDVIRQILDRLLLNDHCLAHRILLNGNEKENAFQELLESDGSYLRVKDNGGRSVLHLAMSWGKRHEIPDDKTLNELADEGDWNSFERKFNNIFETWKRQKGSDRFACAILQHCHEDCLFEVDGILKATPFDYAAKVTALKNLDCYLAKVHELDGNFVRVKDNLNLLVVHEGPVGACAPYTHKQVLLGCAMFNYRNVTLAFIELKPFECDVGGVTFGKYSITLLHVAALARSDEVMAELLDAGLDVNSIESKKQRSALHLACLRGNLSAVKLLLEKGADVNLLDWSCRSPLYLAKWGRHGDVVQLLSEAEDKAGGKRTKITELFVASVAGDLERVQHLLEAGADPNEMSDGGGRPLMEASAEGHLEIVKLLLKFGAEVNATTDNNWTSLMWASMRGHTEIAVLLLSSNADIHKISRFSDTAMSLAIKHGRIEIEQILRTYGAIN